MRRGGFSIVLVLVIVVLAIVGISAGAYYFLKISGQNTNTTYMPGNNSILPTPVVSTNSNTFNITSGFSSVPLSNSDTAGSLQQDLNNTKINSPDADINQLNSAASSL